LPPIAARVVASSGVGERESSGRAKESSGYPSTSSDHLQKLVVQGHRLWIVVLRVGEGDEPASTIDVRPLRSKDPPLGHLNHAVLTGTIMAWLSASPKAARWADEKVHCLHMVTQYRLLRSANGWGKTPWECRDAEPRCSETPRLR